MKGIGSFAICFVLLFLIWNSQNIFFRRYNLKGGYITFLNACLLFVVLVYVYPLKFLFYLMFSSPTFLENGKAVQVIAENEVSKLMVIYGLGFTIIYALFYLMYRRALAEGEALKMSSIERYDTKTSAGAHLINAGIGILSILLASTLPKSSAGNSGWAYMGIPVIMNLWMRLRRRRKKALFPV
jgi:uncharacterized membrane protein